MKQNNRVIKFRIWDNKFKKFWNKGIGVTLQSLAVDYREICLCSDYEKQFQFIQFTGLLDENGKEIYEGDIISTNIFGDRVVGIVSYSGDSFLILGKYIEQKNSVTRYFNCFGNMKGLEVIDNIHENPELLKS